MNTNSKMTLWRDTLNPIIDFRRDFDRLFNGWLSPQNTQADAQFTPACDVEEQKDHYLLTLEMAGVKKDDVKMEVIDDQIVVSGERRDKVRRKGEGQIYSERYYGKYQRIFALPPGIDPSGVEANFQDGLLQILVPKVESAKPRQIKIGDGSSGSKFFGQFLNQSKEKEERHTTNTEKVAS